MSTDRNCNNYLLNCNLYKTFIHGFYSFNIISTNIAMRSVVVSSII